MTDALGLTLEQLRSIPLLRGFSDDQLSSLATLFEKVEVNPGDILFEAGGPAKAFYLLAAGEVTLVQADEETHLLRPPALIGELGAVTDLQRNCRAVVGKGAELWQVRCNVLHKFFEENKEIGLLFRQNLLVVAADKIDRDQTRLQDMRRNLIRTQKAMKRMRDFLLESQDTVVSRPLHEILDGLIKQNRRVNYRVEPPATLQAVVRLDSKQLAPVVQISRTHISYEAPDDDGPAVGARISGVLRLSGPEIPISGKVLRTIGRRVDLELDLLIDEYIAILEGYLTRVQLLDFLV